MGRHLTTTRCGIFGGPDGLKQHFVGRDTQGKAQGAIAIVGVNPIVAGAQAQAGGHFDGFVPRSADLEKDAILALKGNLPIVQAAGRLHDAEGRNELLGLEASPPGDRIGR